MNGKIEAKAGILAEEKVAHDHCLGRAQTVWISDWDQEQRGDFTEDNEDNGIFFSSNKNECDTSCCQATF